MPRKYQPRIQRRSRAVTTRPGEAETSQIIGVKGLKNLGGRVQEEYEKQLTTWTNAVKIYIEMLDDLTIATAKNAISMGLLSADFNVEPASDSLADVSASNWLWDAMNNMDRQSWRSHVTDMLDAPWFGWAVGEIVLEKRKDGRLWLKNIDPRGQDTLHEWEFDPWDHVIEFIQKDPNNGAILEIPMDKLIHVVFDGRKGNPQGRGWLRTLFRTWRFLRDLENLEAIGLERNVGGMPVATLPPEPLTGDDIDDLKAALRDLRMDEEMYLILPNGLTVSPYSGSINVGPLGMVIDRKQKEILQLVFAQFIKLGMGQVGTQALVKGSQDFFTLGLVSIQQVLLEAWNSQLIPFLFRFNQFSFPGMTGFPKITWDTPGKVDIDSLLNAYNTAVSAKAMTPIKGDEEHFRAVMDLPDLPDGVGEEVRGQESGGGGNPQSPFSRFEDEFHLPGKHDQKEHGGGAYAGIAGQTGRIKTGVSLESSLKRRSEISQTPEGQELLTTIDNWQADAVVDSNGNPVMLAGVRQNAQDWIDGKTNEGTGAILSQAIGSAPPSKEPIYRGTLQVGTIEEVEAQYGAGSSFDLLPSSFSANSSTAEQFTSGDLAPPSVLDAPATTPVLFEVEPGHRSFNIEPLAPDQGTLGLREQVTMGRFEVVGVERRTITNSEGSHEGATVKLRQKSVFEGETAPKPKRTRKPRTTQPEPKTPPKPTPAASDTVAVPGVGNVSRDLIERILRGQA